MTIQTTVADSAYPLTDLAADLQEIADRNGDHWIAHNAAALRSCSKPSPATLMTAIFRPRSVK